LVDELRPVVTGMMVGSSRAIRPVSADLECDAVHQALRGLGRLLLPSRRMRWRQLRNGSWEASAPTRGLLTAVLPEFAALLAVPPDPDPLTAAGQDTASDGGTAGRDRFAGAAAVLFVDDLQWGWTQPLAVVDLC